MTPSDDAGVPAADKARHTLAPRWLFILVPALLLLSAALTVVVRWDEFNPVPEWTPEFREVHAMIPVLRSRPLTDEEFARALLLCESGNVQARAGAVSIVEESVKVNPARGGPAGEVMKRVVRTRDPMTRDIASRLLKRIEESPK